MKYLSAFLIVLLLTSCSKEYKNPDFLVGKWKRVNNEENKETFEIWKENLRGIGFTLQESDTVFKEQLYIVTIDNQKHLLVSGVNENPTYFKFTEQTATSFTCENQQNEFPKKISYRLEDGKLNAEVANDDFAIDFVFEKME